MWRIDIDPTLTANIPGISATIGKLATVSDPASLPDQRKFFYPPDVIQVRADRSSSAVNYDLVAAVTGRRPSPLNKDIQDRAFGFRDPWTGRMPDDDGDHIAESSENFLTIQGPLQSVPGGGSTLFDVTSTNDPFALDPSRFQAASGWYIDFAGTGEKALAGPVVIAGKLFFTTYLPEGVVSTTQCAIAEGKGNLYGVNALNGAAIFNWASPDGTTKTTHDRVKALGGGIPSAAVPVFLPEAVSLLIGGGGGATTVDPNIALPRQRTYWFEQPQ